MTRYAASAVRNPVVDALRGLCFVFMTVDHLPWSPVLRFSNANYGLFGFFTAALGFVFLSGFVAGLVYERHRARYGFSKMVSRVLRRIRALYVTQVILCVTLLVAVTLDLPGVERWHLDLLDTDPWKGLLLGAVMLYEPGYLGILPMYCIFFLLTPVLLWQFQKGRSLYVCSLSILVWMVSGLVIRLPDNSEGVDFGAFNPLCYQVLFIFGVAFGTERLSVDRLPRRSQKWLLGGSLGVAALFLILRQLYALHWPFNSVLDLIADSFSGVQLGPLRLLNFAAVGVILYWIIRKIRWSDVDAAAFRWLAFVGRHSLPVFAWSIIAAYASIAFIPSHPSTSVGTLGVALVVASLTIPAGLHGMFVRRRSDRSELGRSVEERLALLPP